MLEVEAKFPANNPGQLEFLLVSKFAARFVEKIEQEDLYFQHPCRDLDASDEALRIRSICGDDRIAKYQICYKGPRLDGLTKTRDELECDLESGESTDSLKKLTSILNALGFSPAGSVRKNRRVFELLFEQKQVVVSLDDVLHLTPFVELEILCEPGERQAATDCILQLASQLGLTQSERRSYLEMLQLRGLA